MNKVILLGRLTRDPETRYSAGDSAMAITRYTLAVDRRFKREGDPTADFINCLVFGKGAEFAEKYFRQGTRIAVSGRIQTGSYTNREGRKIYTTEVVVEEQDFAQSREQADTPKAEQKQEPKPEQKTDADGFMNVADNIDEELPFI